MLRQMTEYEREAWVRQAGNETQTLRMLLTHPGDKNKIYVLAVGIETDRAHAAWALPEGMTRQDFCKVIACLRQQIDQLAQMATIEPFFWQHSSHNTNEKPYG